MRRRRFLEQRPFAQRGSTTDKKSLAVQLRGDPTPAELLLWQSLRKRRLGPRFRRQQIIAGYVVDFYCPALWLAIELDGAVHRERRDYEDQRDLDLAALGVVVLRFDNTLVLERLHQVLDVITRACTALPSRDSLPPENRGEGTGMGG